MLVHVAVYIVEIYGVVPFIERVVEAHVQAAVLHCLAEFAAEIAVRAYVDAVPVPRFGAWPESEALVVL